VTTRVLAALFALAALGVHLGVTRPLRQQAADLGDGYREIRTARQAARHLTRGRSAPRAVGDVGSTRRTLLASLSAARVSGVRLAVRPGRAQGAEWRLTATGELEQVLELFDRLTDPASGLRLGRVTIAPRPLSTVAVEIDGASS